MKKLTYALIILFTLYSPVKAEEILEKPSVKRFGIEAGLGVNLFLPFFQLRASYRLPYNDNRWDINLSHSLNASIGGSAYITTLGTKYYFADNNPKPQIFTLQPFVGGSLGAYYFYSEDAIKLPVGPLILLGIGTDLHIIDNLQLSGSVYLSYPMALRPELNLKVRF